MRLRGSSGTVALLAVALLGAGGHVAAPRARTAADAMLARQRAPEAVLHDYALALAALRRPKASSFVYTVSQLGLHDMEQTHRVYLGGLDERDETLVVDGYTLKAPEVRVLRHRTSRYDVATVAPRPAQYVFAYDGLTKVAGSYAYRFRTVANSPRAFEVVAIELDGRTALPTLVRFKIAGRGARGAGTLRYGRSDAQWVVREASVTAKLANGTTARERIVWSNYRFYDALPKSTFDARRVEATPSPSARPAMPLPGALPTPTPTPIAPVR